MPTKPNVETFAATDANGQAVRFTVSTDIVDYMDSAKTFGRSDMADPAAHGRFQRRMIAIPDRKADLVKPMVLTIGTNNSLYLVRHGDTAQGRGWKLNDLIPSLKKTIGENSNVQVRAIGAAWSDDDRIAIAVAVDDGKPNAPSRVLVAFDLSSKATDWEQVPWQDCGTRAPVRVEGIRVLEEADSTWTVVLTAARDNIQTLYLLRSQMPRSFARALVFNPAVNYQEVFDFEVAIDPFIDSGIAVLGTSGGVRVLSFRPFPQYNADGRISTTPPVVPLPCPPGANVLEAGPTRDGGTDLFIGGNGIHLLVANEFDNQQDAKFVEVASAEAAPNVQDIVVGDTADGSAAVWAILRDGGLLVVKRASGSETWTTPLRFRNEVQAMAPVCGDDHATTSILVVYTDGSAASIWQDAKTGVWNEVPLLVANPGSVTKITCYGTSLRYLDKDGVPEPEKSVKVSSSVLANVILNGKTVFIGPGLPVEAKTDRNGSINLYDRVQSLTPAIYRFEIDGFNECIDINPAGGAHKRFKSMSADELRQATISTPKGQEPLLPENFRTGAERNQVDAVAGGLNNLSQLSNSTNGVVAGVSLVHRDADFSSTLKVQSLPDNYQWGIHADARGVRTLLEDDINKLIHSGSVGKFFVNLGDTIVDFFEGVGQVIKEGVTFVLRKIEESEVFQFICKIGNKIKQFVVETVEQIGSAMTWLWEQLKTGLEKVWSFLKFLFEWDDILVARDMMVKATDEALRYLQNSKDVLKQNVNVGFDQAISTIRQWQKDVGVPPAELPKPPSGTSVSNHLQSSTSSQHDLHSQVSGNSVIGWVTQKIDTILDEIIHIEGADPSADVINAALDFLEGLAGDQFNNLMETWEQVKADVLKVFGNKLPGNDSLSFETIKNLIIMVGADAVVGLLEGIRSLVLRSIDLMATIIEAVRKLMFAKISFPFIEQLVELVAPGTKLDTSFCLIDAIMLLVAIPSTIAYKLIFNKAPFKKGDALNLPFGRVAVQSDVAKDFFAYTDLVGGFFEVLTAGYFAKKAFEQVEAVGAVSKLDIILGLVFGAAGVTSALYGLKGVLNPQEGNEAKKTAGMVGVGAMGVTVFSFVCSSAFAFAKWTATPDASKVDAGVTIPLTTVRGVLDTAVFGILIASLSQADIGGKQAQEAVESLRWIGSVFSRTGTVLFSSAEFVPEPITKAALCASGATLKGVSLITSISQVATEKVT